MKDMKQKLEAVGQRMAEEYNESKILFEPTTEDAYLAGFNALAEQVAVLAEALEFVSTDNYEDSEGMIRPTLSARQAKEALAKLEAFLGGER